MAGVCAKRFISYGNCHVIVETHKHADTAALRTGLVEMAQIVGSAIRQAQHALGPMEVKTAIHVDLPLVEFDAVLMERVLVNLLENAAKYGHESNHSSSNRIGQQAFWFPPKRPQSSRQNKPFFR